MGVNARCRFWMIGSSRIVRYSSITGLLVSTSRVRVAIAVTSFPDEVPGLASPRSRAFVSRISRTPASGIYPLPLREALAMTPPDVVNDFADFVFRRVGKCLAEWRGELSQRL